MKRTILIILALIIIGVLWYLFRPERLFISKTVNEGFPAASAPKNVESNDSAQILFTGDFHGVAHETKGVATVYRLSDGKKVLRFTDFQTSNGPDVHVYLVAAPDANDSDTVTKAGFIEVGLLKGNVGDQNYDLPSDIDLSKYRAVTIWCQRFSVNFGTAPLAPHQNLAEPFGNDFEAVFQERKRDADEFYGRICPFPLTEDMRCVQRQAFAGMLWSKQFYNYVVEVWLIPLFAIETLEPKTLSLLPNFKSRLEWFIGNRPDLRET